MPRPGPGIDELRPAGLAGAFCELDRRLDGLWQEVFVSGNYREMVASGQITPWADDDRGWMWLRPGTEPEPLAGGKARLRVHNGH